MTSAPEAPGGRWSLEIFCMTSARRQQRALQVFDRVRIPGVHVLGTVRPDGSVFLVVDAARIADCVRARRIVTSVDPSAAKVHTVTPQDIASRTTMEPPQATRPRAGVPLRAVPQQGPNAPPALR